MKRLLFITLAAAASAVFADGTVEPVKDGDTWTFTVADGTATYAGGLSGAITLVKEGAGTLDLGTTANTFTGGIEVRGGVLKGAYEALGGRGPGTPPHARISVASGATLAIADAQGSGSDSPLAEWLEVAGAGADGKGAVQRTGNASRHGLFRRVTLTGDTTFGAVKRWGLGGTGGCSLDMGGHRLTILASDKMFEFYSGTITVANPGDIVVAEGVLLVQTTLVGAEPGEAVLRFANGTMMSLYGSNVTWPLVAESAMTVRVNNKNETQNVIQKDVTFGSSLVWEVGGSSAGIGATDRAATLEGALDGPGAFRVSGPGVFRVTGDKPRTMGSLVVANATLELADAGTFSVTNRTVGTNGYIPKQTAATVSGTWANVPRLSLTGATTFAMPASADGIAVATEKHHLMVGDAKDNFGILAIGEGATVSADLHIANEGGSVGAVYLNGGTLNWRGGNQNQGWIGFGGLGYLAVNAGALVSDGYLTQGRTGIGIVRQRGGSVTMKAKIGLSLRCARDNDSYGHWYQSGGTFAGAAHAVLCHADTWLDRKNVEGVLTVAGAGTTFELAPGNCVIAYVSSNAVTSVLTVRDGATLACAKIFKDRMGYCGNNTAATPNFNDETFRAATANSKYYVNFDGGVLKVQNYGTFFQNNFGTYDDPDRLTVYAGGLTVDTSVASKNGGVFWNVPIRKPSGNALKSISLPTDAAFVNKYIAPPRVIISGVNQHGATAVAELDEATGTLTGITVTSPGNDVPGDITVTIASGDGKATYACPFEVGPHATSGGLVKRGAGLLQLLMPAATPNTYEGATVVEAGTLEFLYDSYPAGSPLVLKGGEVTFGGGWLRTVPSLEGFGALTSGSGVVEVKDELRLSCADLFGEGRSLAVTGRLRLADGVRLVVTDPENLAAYAESDKATFLTATEALEGPVPQVVLDEATYGRWRCLRADGGRGLRFGRAKGALLIVR